MLAVALLMVLGLVACGGEAPTPTPLPPTPTPVPPTVTPLPPSPTPMAAAPTSETTGGGGAAASDDDQELVRDALENAEKMTSYHFSLDLKETEFITQPAKLEGDFMAPNVVYIKGTMGDQNVEQIAIGDRIWEKQGSDWVEKSESDDSASDPLGLNAEDMVTGGNPLSEIAGLVSGVDNLQSAGDETINGVTTRHYTFRLDAASLAGASGEDMSGMPDLGGGDLNVDPDKRQLHQLGINLNLGPLMELMFRGFAEAFGTPTPGGAAPTPFPSMTVQFDMTISKHNDPSISIPLTDEMKAAMESE